MKTKLKLFLMIIILLGLSLQAGCGTDNGEDQPSLTFTPETYPVVDGSTVTIPLSEAFAAELMEMPVEEARQYVVHNKTHQAYVNLIEGKADIIFVTSPSAEEKKLAQDNNVELVVTPMVREGFVFLTNADNPVDGLTLKEIQDIYMGKIKNWKEAGGNDVPIIAYQRPVNSGSQTGFLDLVMKGLTPVEAPTEQVMGEMGELIDAVAAYRDQPDGIGYSYYYFVTDMWGNEKVKLLKVNGVYPDNSTITSGKYPIRTAYYAVIRGNEKEDSPARKMLQWILSEEGQAVAQEAGYVKVK